MLSDLLHSSTQSFGSPEAEKKRKKTQGPARSNSVCQIDAPIGPTSTCTNAPGIKTLKLKKKKKNSYTSVKEQRAQPLHIPQVLVYISRVFLRYLTWDQLALYIDPGYTILYRPPSLHMLGVCLGQNDHGTPNTKLMVQKSGYSNQLRLVVYSIIYGTRQKYMAQVPCIGLYKPCTNLPFGVCAMYFYPQVQGFIHPRWCSPDF